MGQQLLPVREFAQEAGVNPTPYKEPSKNLKKRGWSILPVPLVALLLKMKNLLIKNDMRLPSLMKNFVTEMAAIGFSSPEIKATSITDYILSPNRKGLIDRCHSDIVTLTNLTKTYNKVFQP